MRVIRPTAAKVIAQIDLDAEFVRPFLNRLDYLFIRHALEFRLSAVDLSRGSVRWLRSRTRKPEPTCGKLACPRKLHHQLPVRQQLCS